MARKAKPANVESYRLVAVRFHDGRYKELTLREPIAPIVPVPVLTSTGFGAWHYVWNGRDHTVAGLPVYR